MKRRDFYKAFAALTAGIGAVATGLIKEKGRIYAQQQLVGDQVLPPGQPLGYIGRKLEVKDWRNDKWYVSYDPAAEGHYIVWKPVRDKETGQIVYFEHVLRTVKAEKAIYEMESTRQYKTLHS